MTGGLVLTRRVGERVWLRVEGVSEPVEVEVVAVRGRGVRLRFRGPAEVRIRREELDRREGER